MRLQAVFVLAMACIILSMWGSASADDIITTLADGSAEKDLTFSEGGDQTVYLNLPGGARVTSASLDLTGEWLDEWLGSKVMDWYAQTGNGVWLWSGQYVVYFGEIAVHAAETYKLVFSGWASGVDSGSHVSFSMATDYLTWVECGSSSSGPFIGGSSRTIECTPGLEGERVFVKVTAYASFAAIHPTGLTMYWRPYPTDPYLDVGEDGETEWSHSGSGLERSGEFRTTETTRDFSGALNTYLSTVEPDEDGNVLVPLVFHSDSAGIIKISNINIHISYPAIYVDDDALDDPAPGDPSISDPLEDGSPEHPFDAIQEGIDAAIDGDTVIVLDGTFTGTGNRDIDFNGLAITVRSTDPNDPNVVAATIIDCQNAGRAFYFHSGEDSNSLLDGFVISNGRIGGGGGGIYCDSSNPTIKNCLLRENLAPGRYEGKGGGIKCLNSSPTISGCIFIENWAEYIGGGMYNWSGSNPSITNCSFIGNSAQLYYAGGIGNSDGSSPMITNSTFSNNSAGNKGGAMCAFYGSSPMVTNCTFSGNSAPEGSMMYTHWNAAPTLTNCILWDGGNEIVDSFSSATTVTYSNVQGTRPGVGNIDSDPCFVDPSSDDYHLLFNSPCIDAGDNAALPPDTTDLDGDGNTTEPIPWDLDGNPRFFDDIFTVDTGNGTPPIVDMGAYEYTYGGENLPDLEITSEDINFGIIPAVPGEPNSISATVWNVGNIPALSIGVSFTDSSGPIGSNQTIPRLDPSQSETVSIQHSWPDEGFQLITVTVDPANNIEELDETNNRASKVYQIGEPEDMNAILDVSWNSAPDCYTEGTSAIIRGKAEYGIEISGAPDIVSPALGSIVTAQIIDSNGVVTNLQSTLTGPDGWFYIPFIVPGADEGSFTIEISVTDGTLTGIWGKFFCIWPDIPMPRKDLWICELTVSNETPDLGDTVTVCAAVCASPDNNDTVYDVPVTFYAYPPTGGAYQIDSNTIDQMAPDSNETVCVDWTPAVNGLHRIRVIIGPGYSDDNNGNNYKYYNIVVGMFNITCSPKWAVVGQQVQITVDAREQLPSGQLDSITVKDSADQTINVTFVDHPSPTRWIYQTDPLPEGTALGTATITVTGTDSSSVQHTCQGYFEVYETMPDFWLHSCDVNFSNLNPDLAEPITIDAVVHADSSNPETESDIPVSFYSKHLPSDGDYIQISQTQYTDGIIPGEVSTPVSVPWQNAAKGEYVIKVQLGPGFSDRSNGNNAATRAILVGDDIPFDVDFEVVSKTRIDRTVFNYECNVIMTNLTGLTLENVQLELIEVSGNMILPDPPCIVTLAYVGPEESVTSQDTCIIRVDRSVPIEPAEIHWHLTYQIVDICGIMQQTSSTFVQLEPEGLALGDISGDGMVGIADLVRLAKDWLQSDSLADIYPPPPDGDDIVNFQDFAVLAENWLAGVYN